jgi:hypothetical protein
MNEVEVPKTAIHPTDNHAWIHMPPGQGGYSTGSLWCGSDTNSGIFSGLSGFSSDSYATPALLFTSANWCFRIATN